jgi:outer membrane protein assembly factor BamB
LLAFSLQPAVGDEVVTFVTVLIDLGTGEYYWTYVMLEDNKTAIHAIEQAAASVNIHIEVEWSALGAWIDWIGDPECTYPRYAHFFIWNETESEWTRSSLGPSEYVVENGEVIATYCDMDYSDWSNPYPVPTPDRRYPSAMFRYDLTNSGSAPGLAPESNNVKWDYDTEKLEIDSTPAVGYDKVFITGTNGFYALDQKTGDLLWENETIKGQSSPALHDGKVYVGAANGKVYCLDGETGDVLWATMVQPNPIRQSITSSPKIWNQRIYIGTFNERGGNASIVALYIENGTVSWKNETPSVYHSSPAISKGVLYIGIAGLANNSGMTFDPPHGMLALSAEDGSFVWMYETDGEVKSSPAIYHHKIYFTTKDGYLYSLIPNGELDWRLEIGGSVSSPAVSSDGVFVGTGDLGGTGKLLAYKTDKTLLWEREVDGPVQSSPVVADGKVYFATNDLQGTVYSLDTTDGEIVWSYKPSPESYILSSPAVADGEVYIASENGHIYCFAKPVGGNGFLPVPGLEVALVLVAVVSAVAIIALLKRRKK